MIYQKGKQKININNSALFKEDGSVVTNATPEMWEAEGWKPYKQPKPVEEAPKEPSLEEVEVNLEREIEQYYESRVSKIYINDTEYNYKDSEWFQRLGEFLAVADKPDIIELTDDIAVTVDEGANLWIDTIKYGYKCYQNYRKHLNFVRKNLETREEYNVYDYTTGYPKIPEFTLTKKQ